MGKAVILEMLAPKSFHGGRPPVPIDLEAVHRLYEQGWSIREIAQRTGHSYGTVYRAIVKLRSKPLPGI